MSRFWNENYPKNFAQIIIDECHRSAWGSGGDFRMPDAVQSLTATRALL
jgi:superfamily II DNA or RNA helicase